MSSGGSGGSGGTGSGGSGSSRTGSSSGGSGAGSGIPLPVRLGGIFLALPIIFAAADLLFGNKLLCNLKGVDVGFLKCGDEDTKVVTPAPPLPPKFPPSPEPIKPDPIPSSSPTSTPSPTSETPAPVSPSPTKTPDLEQKPIVEPKKSSAPNIGILKESRIFSDRLTSKDQEKSYFFTIDKPSNVSLYLDQVTNQVGMWLYVDTNGNGIIDYGEQIDSTSAYSTSTGTISKTLGPDSYIATVNFKGGNSDYNLQIINNTNDAINLKSLQERKTFSHTGSLNRQNRQKYYLFSLQSTSNVNVVLDQVTSQVGMWLYVDTNGNGVIDYGEQIDSVSALLIAIQPEQLKET
jgi:hypothetical protein